MFENTDHFAELIMLRHPFTNKRSWFISKMRGTLFLHISKRLYGKIHINFRAFLHFWWVKIHILRIPIRNTQINLLNKINNYEYKKWNWSCRNKIKIRSPINLLKTRLQKLQWHDDLFSIAAERCVEIMNYCRVHADINITWRNWEPICNGTKQLIW